MNYSPFVGYCAYAARTCFATSIQRLVRMPGPARTLDVRKMLPDDQASTAPKEVMRLISWLMSYGSDVVRTSCSSGYLTRAAYMYSG